MNKRQLLSYQLCFNDTNAMIHSSGKQIVILIKKIQYKLVEINFSSMKAEFQTKLRLKSWLSHYFLTSTPSLSSCFHILTYLKHSMGNQTVFQYFCWFKFNESDSGWFCFFLRVCQAFLYIFFILDIGNHFRLYRTADAYFEPKFG